MEQAGALRLAVAHLAADRERLAVQAQRRCGVACDVRALAQVVERARFVEQDAALAC